jgi:KipI family sensor histidine kinase inhibitor
MRDAGDSALLVEWDAVIDPAINARAIAVAQAVRAAGAAGIRDVVPTYRSVAVHFDPLLTTPEAVRQVVAGCQDRSGAVETRHVEIPVSYDGDDGPDLADVAAHCGMTAAEVVARHAGADYRVFMLGFLPGFAYLGPLDAALAVPRLATPRTRVPAGAIGLAGRQTGVYPMASPGGWRLIGRTGMRMFDPDRAPASRLSAGDTVRFVPVPAAALERDGAPVPVRRQVAPGPRSVTVVAPGLFTTVQDGGRWGHQAEGVSVSGAMYAVSHRLANLTVGNAADAATLEATILGPELRFEHATPVAVAGADLGATLDGAALPPGVAMTAGQGSVLRFDGRRGARTYIAFGGGVSVPPVLGSRATHVVSGLGGLAGTAVRAGDRLPLGSEHGTSRARPAVPPVAAHVSGGARVRVLPGPHDDWFAAGAIDDLQRSRYTISPRSDRMGYRLSGGVPLAPLPRGEMISDATVTGAIQVPGSGDPIVLMADRQVTGGYPQLATVISADLPVLGQLVPGDWVEFAVCSRAEAVEALVTQEAALRG